MRHAIKTTLSILALIGVMMTTNTALADINARDENGFTALHGAAARGNIEEVKRLIDQGADINACNKECFTPLHGAAYQGYPGIITTLVNAGANINARTTDGWTPLHDAAYGGYPAAITALVNAGANINIRTKGGAPALDLIPKDSPAYKSDIWWKLDDATFKY